MVVSILWGTGSKKVLPPFLTLVPGPPHPQEDAYEGRGATRKALAQLDLAQGGPFSNSWSSLIATTLYS